MSPRWLSISVFLLLAALPLFGGNYLTSQFTLFLIYGMLANSLALIWGRAGLLCFGQAMFFGLGAYIMAAVSKGMLGEALASTYVGLGLAMAGTALFSALLGYFLFWGRGLSGPYLAIVTLAIALVFERLLNNWYQLGGYNGLLDIPPLTFLSFHVGDDYWNPIPQYYLIWAFAFIVFFLSDQMLRSPFGLLLSAINTNPERTAFFGYRIMVLRLIIFVIGALIAALAGALFAAVEGFVSPTLVGFLLSTEVLIWAALGGREILLAAFLGAIAVRWLESALGDLFGDYWILMLGFLLMLSVVLLPRGLIATPLGWLSSRSRRRQ